MLIKHVPLVKNGAYSMRFVPRDFSFEVNDDWWNEAGMPSFLLTGRSYRVDAQAFPDVWEVCIDDVLVTRRQLPVDHFRRHFFSST
jgi:hypothetical protein